MAPGPPAVRRAEALLRQGELVHAADADGVLGPAVGFEAGPGGKGGVGGGGRGRDRELDDPVGEAAVAEEEAAGRVGPGPVRLPNGMPPNPVVGGLPSSRRCSVCVQPLPWMIDGSLRVLGPGVGGIFTRVDAV